MYYPRASRSPYGAQSDPWLLDGQMAWLSLYPLGKLLEEVFPPNFSLTTHIDSFSFLNSYLIHVF